MESLQVKIRQTGAYKLTVLVVLACLCVASTLVCVAIGSVHYTVGQVMDVFRFQPGAPSLSEIFSDPEAEAWLLVWNVRLPRIICGGLVGICLSLGVETVHLGVCTVKRETHEMCPTIKTLAEMLRQRGIQIIEGTH